MPGACYVVPMNEPQTVKTKRLLPDDRYLTVEEKDVEGVPYVEIGVYEIETRTETTVRGPKAKIIERAEWLLENTLRLNGHAAIIREVVTTLRK